MRRHLLSTAVAAVLVTIRAPSAHATENDRLAEELAAAAAGGVSIGGYSGGPEGADEAGDVTGGDHVRGVEPPSSSEDGGDLEDDDPALAELESMLAAQGWPYGPEYEDRQVNRESCKNTCVTLSLLACVGSIGALIYSGVGIGAGVALGTSACGSTALVIVNCERLCKRIYQ